ncbi:translocation/assembly module TamB domain-containing protein [candidate division WOR-3 bacterium]|nr:translocation/assembly module TamB domain-containing protein [candidate division WOR-3 bacterium]
MGRLIGLLVILFLIITITLLSPTIYKFMFRKLEGAISEALPEGSHFEKMEWNVVSELRLKNIHIEGLGDAREILISYFPTAILSRRIRSVYIDGARIKITGSKGGERKERTFPLFYIRNFMLHNASIEYKNHFIQGDLRASVRGGRNRMDISIKSFSGLVDSIPILEFRSDIGLRKTKIYYNIYSLRFNHSSAHGRGVDDSFGFFLDLDLSIPGKFLGKEISGRGLFNIKGKGKNFKVKGKLKQVCYEGYYIDSVSVSGTTDSIYLESEGFTASILNRETLSIKLNLDNFDIGRIHTTFPPTSLSGKVNISKRGHAYLFKGDLKGNVARLKSDAIYFDGLLDGEKLKVRKFLLLSQDGNITLEGSYSLKKRTLEGFVNINNLNTEKLHYSHIVPFKGRLSLEMKATGKRATGSFWIEDGEIGEYSARYAGGNFEMNEIFKPQGELDIFFQDMKLPWTGFDAVYYSGTFNGKKARFRGFTKGKGWKTNTVFEVDATTCFSVKFEKFNMTMPEYSIYLSSRPTLKKTENGWSLSSFTITDGDKFTAGIMVDIDTTSAINGNISIIGLDLKKIGMVRGIDLKGLVDAIIGIHGNTAKPVLSILLNGVGVGSEYPIGDSLKLKGKLTREKLVIDKLTIFERGSRSLINGSYTFRHRYLSFLADLNDAGPWLFTLLKDAFKTRDCQLTGTIRVNGSINSPEVFGKLRIKNGLFVEPSTGTIFRNILGSVELKRNRVYIKSIKGNIGDGTFSSKGNYFIKEKAYSISVGFRNTPFTYGYVSTIFNGDFKIKGKGVDIKIDGGITIDQATITVPFRMKLEENLKRPKNLVINLGIDASNYNIWLKNENADIELGGKVNFQYKRGDILLQGEFDTKQGKFNYLYTDFTIKEGKFMFRSSAVIDPEINLLAYTTPTQTDSVFLNVSGTMRNPEFNIYSKPPRSLNEIIVLLGLNLEWEDLVSVSKVEDAISSSAFRAFDYWARLKLAQEFKKRFGFDIAQVEKGRAYKLVVGKYISRNLYIRVGTEVFPRLRLEYQADYKFAPWGMISAEEDKFGSRKVLLKFVFRY